MDPTDEVYQIELLKYLFLAVIRALLKLIFCT